MIKVRQGTIVQVRFWDHCEDGGTIPCIVWGRMVHCDDHEIKVSAWEWEGREPVSPDYDYNVKYFSILQSTIIDLQRLRVSSTLKGEAKKEPEPCPEGRSSLRRHVSRKSSGTSSGRHRGS